jgi:two-component system, OmpR family, sensor histidine kinase MprB
MSLRVRLALISAVAVAAVVVVAATISYSVVSSRLRDEVDDSLSGATDRLADLPAPEIALPFFSQPAVGPRLYLQIAYADGRTERPEGQHRLPVDADDLEIARGNGTLTFRDVRVDGAHLRIAIAPAPEGKAVQYGRSVEDVDATIDDLRVKLLIVAITGVAGASLLALLMAGAILRPVARLTRAAEHVADTQDLKASIDVRRQDEVGRLATSVNSMLAALDASRRQQRQLVNDASHELRTPLTSLRTNIEVLARQPDMPQPDRHRLLRDVTTQLEELTMLMDDLAELARDDATPVEETTDVDLDELVMAAIDRTRPRAPEITIDVGLLEPSRVRGRRQQLERALVNVLDNACKWSPAGERVEVRLSGGTITVRDRGPGIDRSDLPHVFDRFYRAPVARGLPGSGLGLAIVRRIVADHGGSVTLENAPNGGTIASIRLPADDEQGTSHRHGKPERAVRS